MKKSSILNTAVAGMLTLFMLFMFNANAQDQKGPGKGKGDGNHASCQNQPGQDLKGPFGNYAQIPGITEKQLTDIKAIRIALLKEINAITDQVNEKEARLRTLTRAEKYDKGAVEKTIDEIAALQASKRKRVEGARQQIRSMLTPEQQLWFDQHCQGHKQGQKQGSRHSSPKGGSSQKHSGCTK
jgi:Spy/CpxP family protein refolding chaperone